jgi:hypothetical protein
VTTEAKVGAFVLGCFSILAFTLIYLINAQLGGHMFHTTRICVMPADWNQEHLSCSAESLWER